jgi:hypothetical protein
VPICGTVSQISPPIRIVLFAVIGLLAAWMLFLRPKTEPTVAPAPAAATAPGVTGLSNAADKASAAGAAQEARDGKVQEATGEAGGATGTVPATKPGAKGTAVPAAERAAAKTLPEPVRKALAGNKILVLGFFNPKAADDRAVRRALADVNRWKGEVVVRTADIARVGRFGAVTRGADVRQSPTVVVVDRNEKAEALVGFEDTLSIDQAVVDAMRASGGLIKDRYLSAINGACAGAGVQVRAIPSADSPSLLQPSVKRHAKVWKRFMTRFAAIKAPARWRGLKRAAMADGRAMSANYAAWLTALGSNPSAATTVGSLVSYGPKGAKLTKSWNARMDKHNVLSCGAQT